jgi:MFS family permease
VKLPRTVWALGLVSLFTDVSSEMIAPLLPAFLASLGAGAVWIGLIDGVGDTTAALVRLWSGRWADAARRRKPLVVVGYALSSCVRPLTALVTSPLAAVGVRFADRVGKGLRSAPRDALIADATVPEQRGAAFGVHQAMDHAGAFAGPLVALLLVAGLGLAPTAVFALAAVPAAIAMVILVAFVHEPPHVAAARAGDGDDRLDPRLKALLVAVGLFSLASATELFLILRAHELGVPAALAPLVWSVLQVPRILLGGPLGSLSDRLPRRRFLVAGWTLHAVAVALCALVSSAWQLWPVLVFYGAVDAVTAGAAKALVAEHAPARSRGRAFGWYNFTLGISALPASLGFGLVWDAAGAPVAFLSSAVLAVAAVVVVLVATRE